MNSLEPPASGLGPRDQDLWLGTSSWSHDSWVGPFYPSGTPPADYIRHYARRLRSVEVDATFYGIPAQRVVEGWREKTPAGFLFAAKFPRAITHDKRLVGCEAELEEFLGVMARLGDRLGPLLLQFPYFRKGEMSLEDLLSRLDPFLARLPAGGPRFALGARPGNGLLLRQRDASPGASSRDPRSSAETTPSGLAPRPRRVSRVSRRSHYPDGLLEVRNKAWVVPALLDRLAARGVALAWIDHPWFWDPEALVARSGVRTAGFVYVRWLGDRVAIEKMTREWSRTLIDREARLRSWVRALRAAVPSGTPIYGYFNNHYAGYAVGSVDLFERLWREGSEEAPRGG